MNLPDERTFEPHLVVLGHMTMHYISKIEEKYGDPYDWLKDVGTPFGKLFFTDDEIVFLINEICLRQGDGPFQRNKWRKAKAVIDWAGFPDPGRFEVFPLVRDEVRIYHAIGIQNAYWRL